MIELKDVAKRYTRSGIGLYQQNLALHPGEIVGVLGENGSGKTTLLKVIAGIGDIQEGEVLAFGKPVAEQYDKIAFITEEGSYFPAMDPFEYGQFLADFFPRFDEGRYHKLLDFFELELHKKIRLFSSGQKSKLELCAGFSKGAKLIVMDEPFNGHDMFTRRDFLKVLVSQLEGDEIVVLVTHMMEEVENLLDRAIIMRHGLVKADCYLDDLREAGTTLAEFAAEVTGYDKERYKALLK